MNTPSLNSTALSGQQNARILIERLLLPSDRRYSPDHVWVKPAQDSGLYMLGITEVIVRRFLSIERIEFAEEFQEITNGEGIASILGHSNFDQQATSFALVSPLSGMVLPINKELRKRFLRRAKTELVLQDPYLEGWLMGIIGEADEFEGLMTAQEYRSILLEQARSDPAFLYHD
jgi:glycine cleavage system H protein